MDIFEIIEEAHRIACSVCENCYYDEQGKCYPGSGIMSVEDCDKYKKKFAHTIKDLMEEPEK